jgi:hypothetical protein
MRWRGLVSEVGSREGGAGEYEAGGICMPTLFGLGDEGWRQVDRTYRPLVILHWEVGESIEAG